MPTTLPNDVSITAWDCVDDLPLSQSETSKIPVKAPVAIKAISTYAVDFETYYDDELSVTIQGAVNYARAAHIYMVAIRGPGVEYVGPVETAPWWDIDGHHWVSHNAGFDMAVYWAAVDKGQVPGLHGGRFYPAPINWDCTADLVAYIGAPRSLADACKELYNVVLDKAMRTGAKGKHWPEDFSQEQQNRMLQYAGRDAAYCLQLWEDYHLQWPPNEITLSRITRERAHLGVKVDRHELYDDILKLELIKKEALRFIPWADSGVVLSHKKVKEYCADREIPAPVSLAEDNGECEKWLEQYGASHTFVRAIWDYRKANRLQKIVQGMIDRIMPNGRMNFGLKYFGAHTGRWSGSDGLNMQNPNKHPQYGVDIRGRLIADEGMEFIIWDLAQIEPRCSAWLVRDEPMMQAMGRGYGIYEAAAVSMGTWDGKAGTFKVESKEKKDFLYDLVKAQVLALGYGAGPEMFVVMAKLYCGLDIPLEQAEQIVKDYRKNNYRVTNHWKRLEEGMRSALIKGEPYLLQLPSGRILAYTDLHYRPELREDPKNPGKLIPTGRKIMTARQGRGKTYHSWWGGKLFENLVQATARDVLGFAIINLEEEDIPVLWSAHDEGITEVLKGFDKQIIKNIVTQTPPWLEGLVLDAEVVSSDHYLK